MGFASITRKKTAEQLTFRWNKGQSPQSSWYTAWEASMLLKWGHLHSRTHVTWIHSNMKLEKNAHEQLVTPYINYLSSKIGCYAECFIIVFNFNVFKSRIHPPPLQSSLQNNNHEHVKLSPILALQKLAGLTFFNPSFVQKNTSNLSKLRWRILISLKIWTFLLHFHLIFVCEVFFSTYD